MQLVFTQCDVNTGALGSNLFCANLQSMGHKNQLCSLGCEPWAAIWAPLPLCIRWIWEPLKMKHIEQLFIWKKLTNQYFRLWEAARFQLWSRLRHASTPAFSGICRTACFNSKCSWMNQHTYDLLAEWQNRIRQLVDLWWIYFCF